MIYIDLFDFKFPFFVHLFYGTTASGFFCELYIYTEYILVIYNIGGRCQMTVEYCGFEWDGDKNMRNIRLHQLSFETAVRVFNDPFFLEKYDDSHSSTNEDRYVGIGRIKEYFITLICFTDSSGKTRIISARKATAKEVKEYEKHRKNLQAD